MSAERGPSGGGTMTMARPTSREGGMGRSSISRSTISSASRPLAPSGERAGVRANRTMSRREFDSKFAPFSPSGYREQSSDYSQKPQELITRPFSTIRDGATISRSSIDKVKQEISSTISLKKPENQINEVQKSMPKMRLYEIRERPKVSLFKPVSLEKKNTVQKPLEELKRISLVKESNSIRHSGLPRISEGETLRSSEILAAARMTREKSMQTRPIERPVRFAEAAPRVKEQILFLSEQRHTLPQIVGDQKREPSAYFNKPLLRAIAEQRNNGKLPFEIEKTAQNNEWILNQRIAELAPKHGLEKTHQILTNEGKNVSLEAIFRIAVRQSWQDKIEEITQAIPAAKTDAGAEVKAKPVTKEQVIFNSGTKKEENNKQEGEGSEKKLVKDKEDGENETCNEPLCCNHHCVLKNRKDGIGTCPRSGVLFTYDEQAPEKARRANRPVRRSDWNVKNTYRLDPNHKNGAINPAALLIT
jgi:hypothetical protein